MKNKIRILKIAIKYWLRGGAWKDGIRYAKRLVSAGWKK
jgi:hypothetical protein